MGETIKIVDFEKNKEIIEAERRYGALKERYKKLKFLELKPEGRKELETGAGNLVEEIENFEEEIEKLQTKIFERNRVVGESFKGVNEKEGFEAAYRKYGTESAREVDRLIKSLELRNKAAELKEQAVSLFK